MRLSAMAERLKMFVMRIGRLDIAIAAPTRKDALDAWGVHDGRTVRSATHRSFEEIKAQVMKRPGVLYCRLSGRDSGRWEAIERRRMV